MVDETGVTGSSESLRLAPAFCEYLRAEICSNNSVSVRDSQVVFEAGATPSTNLSSSFSHRKCRESSAAMAAKTVFMARSVTIGSYITRHRGTGLPAAFHSCVKGEVTRGFRRSKSRNSDVQTPQNLEQASKKPFHEAISILRGWLSSRRSCKRHTDTAALRSKTPALENESSTGNRDKGERRTTTRGCLDICRARDSPPPQATGDVFITPPRHSPQQPLCTVWPS